MKLLLSLNLFILISWCQVFAQCDGTWGEVSSGGVGPRSNAAMVYDSQRNKYILFGGSNGTQLLNSTQIFDPVTRTWSTLSLPVAPPARAYAGMIYDKTRDKVYLFGGYNGALLGDTWEFDPQFLVWRRKSPSKSPSPRFFHSFVYDSNRSVGVLFGGTRSTTGTGLQDNETWEWNGTTWVQRVLEDAPYPLPLPRTYHAMAYDANRNVTVLHGGYSYETGFFSDTWEWNGNVWVARELRGSVPESARYHRMVFDSRRQTIVLTAQEQDEAEPMKVYEWNGDRWMISAFGGPMSRSLSQMIFDESRGRAVLFGGYSPSGEFFSDMWEWAGTGYSQPLSQIVEQPRGNWACLGGEVHFSVQVSGPAAIEYQWRKNGVVIPGATQSELRVTDFTETDESTYDCIIRQACGELSTIDRGVSICNVDLNCDHLVDFSDYLEFLSLYTSQSLEADVTKDGQVDFSDFLEFSSLYDQGC